MGGRVGFPVSRPAPPLNERRIAPADRALAKAAGIASRIAPALHDLMAIEGLPLAVRRQVVAVVEETDLLRFHLREATLAAAIGPPLKPDRPSRMIKPKPRKAKAKRQARR